MEALKIRNVQISDAARLAEIYSYYVLHTAVYKQIRLMSFGGDPERKDV